MAKIVLGLLIVLLAALLISTEFTDTINSLNPFADRTPAVTAPAAPDMNLDMNPATTPADTGFAATVTTETPFAITPIATDQPVDTLQTPAAGTGTQPAKTPAATRTYLTYTNPNYSFSINYPSDWQVEEFPDESGQDPGVPRGATDKTDVVEFYSPAISRCNHGNCVDVRSEMHVEIDSTPGATDLDQYYIHDVAAISTGYPIEVTGHTAMFKLSGQNAYELDFHVKDDPIDIRVERAYTMGAGKAFILTYHTHVPYSGEVDQGVLYSNVVADMFRSFRILTANKPL